MSKKKRAAKELRKEELAERRRQRMQDVIDADPSLQDDLEKLRESFIKKFGREPGPGDPIFFDPDKDVPTPMSEAHGNVMQTDLIRSMFEAGLPPELAFAYSRSGYLISEANFDLVPKEGHAAWNAAVAEWDEMSEVERAATIESLKAGVS